MFVNLFACSAVRTALLSGFSLLTFLTTGSVWANQPPVAVAGDDQQTPVAERVFLNGSASSDADGDELKYGWELIARPDRSSAILRDSATVSPSVLVDVPGLYEVSLKVYDGKISSSADTVRIQTLNSAPVAIIITKESVIEGERILLDGRFSEDVDHDALSYQWVLLEKPQNSQAAIDDLTQVLTRFTADQPGNYRVKLTVSDGVETSIPETTLITAQALVNHAPKITSAPFTTTDILNPYHYQLTATDADADTLNFSLVSPPLGMVLDSVTGLISWTPNVSGYFPINLKVTDGQGGSDTQYFRLNVIQPGANDTPPDSELATELNPRPFPSFFEQTRFLAESVGTTGAVINSVYTPEQSAVVNGSVIDAVGSPAASVSVQIVDHPEWGITYTDAKGRYSLLLNGGSHQTLRFEKRGYPIVEQQVSPKPGRYQVLNPVRLVVGDWGGSHRPHPQSNLAEPLPLPPAQAPILLTDSDRIHYETVALDDLYALHYSSERVIGHGASRALKIPLTEAELPESLSQVNLDLRIAGQRYHYAFAPDPDFKFTFDWAQVDAYQRRLNGKFPAEVEVTYQHGENAVSRFWTLWLGTYINEYPKLGGWSLNIHHAWQADGKTLYLGDGKTQGYGEVMPESIDDWHLEPVFNLMDILARLNALPSFDLSFTPLHQLRIATTLALWTLSLDELLEIDPSPHDWLSNLFDLKQWPLGIARVLNLQNNDYLIADGRGHRILLVQDGVPSILAKASDKQCSDGFLCNPTSLLMTKSQQILVAAQGSKRIYELDLDGNTTVFAGDGKNATFDQLNGDGGQAIAASFGLLGDMQQAADGTIYLLDNYTGAGYRIRAISPHGFISTILKSDASDKSALAMVINQEGTLVISENGCNIRLRYANETSQRYDISSLLNSNQANNTTPVCHAPDRLAIHPDGGLYLGVFHTGQIYKLAHQKIQQLEGLTRITSNHEQAYYWFDESGRHIKTTDLEQQIIFDFAYDESGFLKSVTDAKSQTLIIARNEADQSIQIIMSDGKTNTLRLGDDGYLKRISRADGEQWYFGYTHLGQLNQVEAANRAVASIYYTPEGNTNPVSYTAIPTVDDDVLPSPGNTNLVATIAGEFVVTPNGAANYSIPIEVPPGRGGLTPKLAIQYNSQTGRSLLGVGWSLTGLSNIHRCKKTLTQDNINTAVELTNEDALCLDGKRMRLVGGTHFSEGAVYRLEIDTYSKIEIHQGASSIYFKVFTKSGEIMEYGNTADSEVDKTFYTDHDHNTDTPEINVTVIQRWALNRVTDTAKNYFDIHYEEYNVVFLSQLFSRHQVDRIDYSGNIKTSAATHAHVKFNYEYDQNSSFGYLAQSYNSNTSRLASIDTYSGSDLVRRYAFDYYEPDFSNPPTRLAQIRQCTNETETQCVAPTLIEWYPASEGKIDQAYAITAQTNAPSDVGDDRSRDTARILDFNGDGISDIAYTDIDGGIVFVDLYDTNGQVSTSTHLNSGVSAPSENYSMWGGTPFIPMDYDGDGDTDILVPQVVEKYYDWDDFSYPYRELTGWEVLSYDHALNDISVSDSIVIGNTKDSWGCIAGPPRSEVLCSHSL